MKFHIKDMYRKTTEYIQDKNKENIVDANAREATICL
jgi:hypothetical protein